jgi:5-methylthioribose kinase
MELDIEDFDALRHYLAERGHLGPGQQVEFQKLFGGVSNRTVKVKWTDGNGWVLKQALAKLRVDADWFSSPDRIEVEAKALRWLNQIVPAGTTPAFIFEDKTNYLMAMAAIPEPHENWKAVLLSGRVVPDHFQQFAMLLGTIHRKSTEAGADVSEAFAGTAYFENLRLEPYYLHAAQNVPQAAGFLTTLATETLRHKDSLVHGDFSPKNTLIYCDKLVLLDYEVVHFGDPAFDIGFALTHFLSKANHLPELRVRFIEGALLFWKTYREEVANLAWFEKMSARSVWHTLACLLARVAGKSPLEYLTDQEKSRQTTVALKLIGSLPADVPELIREFSEQIEAYANH